MATRFSNRVSRVALVVVVMTCPVLLLGDNLDVLLSIPGNWQEIGVSAAPDGILAPFADDTVHRPAIAIEPLSSPPRLAAAVHRFGVLDLVGASTNGDLRRIDRDSGDSEEIVAGDGANPLVTALAFDSDNDVFYGLAWHDGDTWLVTVNPETGVAADGCHKDEGHVHTPAVDEMPLGRVVDYLVGSHEHEV